MIPSKCAFGGSPLERDLLAAIRTSPVIYADWLMSQAAQSGSTAMRDRVRERFGDDALSAR